MQQLNITAQIEDVKNNIVYYSLMLDSLKKETYKLTFPEDIYITLSDIPYLSMIPTIFACGLAALTKNAIITTNYHLTEEQISGFKNIIEYQHISNMWFAGKDIIPEFNVNFNVPDRQPFGVKTQIFTPSQFDIMCSMSGGIDSLTQYAILKDIGKKILPFTIMQSSPHYTVGIKSYLNTYFKQVNINPAVIKTNSNQRQHQFYEYIMKQMNIEKSEINNNHTNMPKYFYEDILILSWNFIAMTIANNKNIPLVIMGDEADTNQYYKDRLFNPDFGQSYLVKRIINSMNLNVEIGSILYPLYSHAEFKILNKMHPELLSIASSCIIMFNQEGGRFCYKCDKCLTTFINMLIGNINPIDVNFSSEELYNRNPFFKRNGFSDYLKRNITPEELRTLYRVLIDMNEKTRPEKLLLEILQQKAQFNKEIYPEIDNKIYMADNSIYYTIPKSIREKVSEYYKQTIDDTNIQTDLIGENDSY